MFWKSNKMFNLTYAITGFYFKIPTSIGVITAKSSKGSGSRFSIDRSFQIIYTYKYGFRVCFVKCLPSIGLKDTSSSRDERCMSSGAHYSAAVDGFLSWFFFYSLVFYTSSWNFAPLLTWKTLTSCVENERGKNPVLDDRASSATVSHGFRGEEEREWHQNDRFSSIP